MNLVPVKYFPSESEETKNFSLARDGYFLEIGKINDESCAIVRDRQTGRLLTTYIDHVRFETSVNDFLIDRIFQSVEELVVKSKKEEMEVRIKKVFKEFGQ